MGFRFNLGCNSQGGRPGKRGETGGGWAGTPEETYQAKPTQIRRAGHRIPNRFLYSLLFPYKTEGWRYLLVIRPSINVLCEQRLTCICLYRHRIIFFFQRLLTGGYALAAHRMAC